MSDPDTYYHRTMADRSTRPALSGVAECDVAIIGGGLAGLTTALQLSRAGRSVAILEGQTVGYGASGRNGGFVGAGYGTGNDEIAHVVGGKGAQELYRLSMEGVEYVRDNIRDLGIDEALPRAGIMTVRRYEDAAGLKAHAEQMRRLYGVELEFVDRDAVRAVLRSSRYFQALRNPASFHIHPLNYLRALAREIERLGGHVYEGSAVTSADVSGTEKRVTTASGEIKARHVVFATGGYTGKLNAQLQRAFLPIATYVMVTEEAPELIATAIGTTDAIGDYRKAGDYYRVVDDGRRVLWGGRITTRAASTEGLVRELRGEMVGTYPQLAGLKTEIAWSGLMSYARHWMPQIGRLGPGAWYCTAFGGHGLNTTAIGGKLIAEAILGESERYRHFERFGLSWAGGVAGLAVAQLTYWKLQAQDRWRERAA